MEARVTTKADAMPGLREGSFGQRDELSSLRKEVETKRRRRSGGSHPGVDRARLRRLAAQPILREGGPDRRRAYLCAGGLLKRASLRPGRDPVRRLYLTR